MPKITRNMPYLVHILRHCINTDQGYKFLINVLADGTSL